MKIKRHSRPRLKHSGVNSSGNLKVLVTCGPTWVPIDDVRVISNVSTGEMGHLIAQAFRRRRAEVTIIEGPVTHALRDKKIKIIKYRFFDELARVLKKELFKKYDIIVHAAAVSDFKVEREFKNKISSEKDLRLNLVPTRKLIKDIKLLSPKSYLVGFKLESNLNPGNIFKSVKPLFTPPGCDLVVANSVTGGYQGFIVNEYGDILKKTSNKRVLVQSLIKNVTVRNDFKRKMFRILFG